MTEELFSTEQAVTRVEALAERRLMQKQAQARYSAAVTIARHDCATFCELALRDEETGAPIENAPFQEEWHDVADQGHNMVIWAHPESGKSQQLCVGRVIWELGRDPRKRFAILSSTLVLGKKLLSAIKGHIEENPVVHHVFPELKRGNMWRDTLIEIERPYGIKDPSVQAFGTDQGAIQGARLDGLFVDDALTEDNTRTQYQRDKMDTWMRASAFSRLSKDAQIFFLANAWHPDDMAHRLEKQGWWAKRYPVLDELGNSTWPERWPAHRIEKWRKEVLGPSEFVRQMLCQSRSDDDARFKEQWIRQCIALGDGRQLPHALHIVPEGYRTYTGVDLGVRVRGKRKEPDLTVLFTICVWPTGEREVMDVCAGRWAGPDIIRRIAEVHHRYQSVVIVENNAAQDFLLQFTRGMTDIPIKPFNTGKNKWNIEFGIESIATEMANSKWIIPSSGGVCSPEVEAWVNEMLYYDPKAHTGDRLMASWFAREGARMVKPKVRFGTLDLMKR